MSAPVEPGKKHIKAPVELTEEQIAAIASEINMSAYVAKATGYSLVADTEIAKIHASGSDNQVIPDQLSDLSDDATHRIVTDTEKSTWNGKSDLALGVLSTNAYYGDKGKTAYDHSQATHAPAYTPWPIGSVFIAVVDTNPNTLLGYGTWSAFGVGRVLVGLDSGDASFDTAEETGGEKTSTPDAHSGTAVGNHIFTQPSAHSNHVFTQPSDHAAHVHSGSASHTSVSSKQGSSSGNVVTTNTHGNTGNPTATLTHANGAVDAHSAHSGGGVDAHSVTQPSAHAAMSIVQPYIVVYMWKRTA